MPRIIVVGAAVRSENNRLHSEVKALREENARLRVECDAAYSREATMTAEKEAEVARLTAALAGTVAQVEEQRKRAERAEAEVARNLRNATYWRSEHDEEQSRRRAAEAELVVARAEYKRQLTASVEETKSAEAEVIYEQERNRNNVAQYYNALRDLVAEVEREFGEQPAVEALKAAKRLL